MAIASLFVYILGCDAPRFVDGCASVGPRVFPVGRVLGGYITYVPSTSQDPGLAAPVTPPMTSSTAVPQTPRQQHATRMHEFEVEEDHDTKRAKMESQKKQKINQLRGLHESMIRAVKVGTNEYATMDNYEHEMKMEEDVPEVEFWSDEDISSSSKEFQKSFGQRHRWTSHLLHQKLGWINLQMEWKSKDFWKWEFCKRRRSAKMKSQAR